MLSIGCRRRWQGLLVGLHESREVSFGIERFRVEISREKVVSKVEPFVFFPVIAAHDDNASRVSLEINSINACVVVKP